jgi:hypothetical protein
VCEVLSDLPRYNGKVVIVVGRSGGTDEGSWLSQECEHPIVTNGFTWPNSISTSFVRRGVDPPVLPQDFKWNEKVLAAKLKEVQSTTKLRVLKEYNYSDSWVAMYGRFETRLPLQVALDGRGNLRGYGFGHLAYAPAQLIWAEKGYRRLKAK